MIVSGEKKRGFQGINVVPLRPRHVLNIEPQAEQAGFLEKLPEDWAKMLSWGSHSHAILDKQGTIASICGVFIVNDDPFAWAVHSDKFQDHVKEVTWAFDGFAKDVINEHGAVFGFVKHEFEGGHRWMEMLNFQPRADRDDFGPDYLIYERTI